MHRFVIAVEDESLRAAHLAPGALPAARQAPLAIDGAALLATQDPAAYGALLGRAVFASPDIALLFAGARRAAGPRLPIIVEVTGSRHAALHWERLRVPLGGERWAEASADQRFGLARRVESDVDRPLPDAPARAARALLVVAAPPDLPAYGLGPFDARAVAEELRRAIGPRRCELLAEASGAAGPPTLDAIVARLTLRPAAILHLVCHGRLGPEGEPVLYLAGPDGRAAPTPLSALRARLDMVGDAAQRPRLVLLMSCGAAAPDAEAALTGAATQLIAGLGTPAVISATEPITLETARRLSAAFYRHLRLHGAPDRALAEARASVSGRPDAAVIALFSRLDGDELFRPSRLTWQVRAAAWAALVVGVLAALLAAVYTFAFEPAARLAGDAFAERVLPAPPWALPPAPVLRFAQAEGCGPPGALAEAMGGAASLAQGLTGRPVAARPFGEDPGDTVAAVTWACDAAGDTITIGVAFPAPPAAPIELLQEPGELALAAGSPIAAGDLSRAAALYAVGAYDEAWAQIKAYPPGDPLVAGPGLAWLRGNLLLRQGQWEAARDTLEEGVAAARGADAARLALNRATVDMLVLEARRVDADAPLPCSDAGRELLDRALAAPGLPPDLRAAALLARARQLTLCPSASELVDITRRAPAALAEAEALLDARHPLWAVAQATRALHALRSPGPPSERQGRVQAAARAAIAAAPELPTPYYVLGQLYASYGRRSAASACFLDYGARAPLPWQRRDALRQAIRAWKWPVPGPGEPRADLASCRP